MRTIYIDENFICHSDYAEGRTEITTSSLDSIPDSILKFYIYVPAGTIYTKSNGTTIKGEFAQCLDSVSADMEQMRSKITEYELDAAQREYERQLLTEYESALTEIERALGV